MKTENVYLAAQIKAMDEGCGIDPDVLMDAAADALLETVCANSRDDDKICVVCGKGNNGGDGYALAYKLLSASKNVFVCAVDLPASVLAIKYRGLYEENGGVFVAVDTIAAENYNVIVDCMFGFSFKGALKGNGAKAAELINGSNAFVISADLPSGLCADSDELPILAVKADVCCTFTGNKCCLVSYPSKALCGRVIVKDIGIPEETIERFVPFAYTDGKVWLNSLPQREENSHKGTFGTLSALCGNEEMCGAAFLACNAAYRTGVGLVKLYTEKACGQVVKTMLPEAIITDIFSASTILNAKSKALLLGCGCGRTYDGIIKELLCDSTIPAVIDADGINCIASDIELYKSVKCPIVITPHPAEMARLTGKSTAEVNATRIKTALDFATDFGFTVVLKGKATVVASPDGRVYINQTGNSGLAKGGSGDVLSGIIASLLVQGADTFTAAVVGVYIHGAAADALKDTKGTYAMLPSELAEEAGKLLYFR